MFAAAAASNRATQNGMIQLVRQFAAVTSNNTAMGMVYDPTTGVTHGGTNSPAVGAMFAPLVLRYVQVFHFLC